MAQELPDEPTLESVLKPLREAVATPALLLDLTPLQITMTFLVLEDAEAIRPWIVQINSGKAPKPATNEIAEKMDQIRNTVGEAFDKFPRL